MGIKERKDRDREEMKKLILDTSLKLFTEEGFGKVSMRKIASKMEYSPGTIYLYFKNKDEILYELHNIAFDKFYSEQMKIKDIEDPMEKLIKHGEIYIDFALKNTEYYDLMFIMNATGFEIAKKEEWKVGFRTFDYLKSNIQECFDAGYFKGDDVMAATIATWSLVHGIVSLYIRNRLAMIPENYVRHMMSESMKFFFENLKKQNKK